MITQHDTDVVSISRHAGASPVVLVCEHASPHIPDELNDLGLSKAARLSHAAWDPGAFGVAQTMADTLEATLVASKVSRLVYDCNRPPEALDAMPHISEAYEVPGNAALSSAERQARTSLYYTPFRRSLAAEIARTKQPVIVTIHSFTPVYHGTVRTVEIGIVHDTDHRLADAILDQADWFNVQRNAPYGPSDGVTHTLRLHGVANGHLNVMIEIRNDLIETHLDQAEMGRVLANWLTKALHEIGVSACKA